MIPLPSGIEQKWTRIFTRVYKRARTEAANEIKRTFGQAWRGGRFQALFLAGRIPFTVLPENHGTILLSIPASTDTTTHGDYGTQHIDFLNPYAATTLPIGASATDTVLTVASAKDIWPQSNIMLTQAGGSHLSERVVITAVDHAAKILTLATGLVNGYAAGDAAIIVPDVTLGSGDIGWVPSWDGLDNTGFDLTLSRRVSLTNSEFGVDTTHQINLGHDHADVNITFSPHFAAGTLPVITAITEEDATRVTVVNSMVTTSGATLRVWYVPPIATGSIGYSVTGLGLPAASERTDAATVLSPLSANTQAPSSTDTDPTASIGSLGSTHNSSLSDTLIENQDHTHTGGGTGGESVDHVHPMTHTHPVGDHTHRHDHAHPLYAHVHQLTEQVVGSDTGHTHTFTGDAENAPADIPFTLHWQASGTRESGAVTKNVSWWATSG